jgi:AraC family transcriptional regulator
MVNGRSQRTAWLARAALAIVARDYRRHALRIGDVAAEVNVTRWHLARVLRHATGDPFLAHLHRARVTAACELLTSGDALLSIKEIAYDVGYASTRELDRRFRKATGMTPGEYRRLHRPVMTADAPPRPRFLQQVS